MLLYIFFVCFVPMMTTEAQTVSPVDQEMTTTRQNAETTDVIELTPTALEVIPTNETISAKTSALYDNGPSTPHVESAEVSKSPSASTLNEMTESTTESPMAGDSPEMQATTTTAISSKTQTESVVPAIFTPTTICVSSTQTSVSQAQTESAETTDTPLKTMTQEVPAVGLTEMTTTTTEKMTTKLENTTDFVSQTSTTDIMTKAQKTTTEQTSKTTSSSSKYEKPVKQGKIVAGIIGGALIVMFIAFLVILYKKHVLKQQQIATTDWAGPTPFLETGGESNGHVTLRSANRISLTSFLPQRLSKRLTLLAEADEMQEMHELNTPTTFVRKDQPEVKKNGKKGDKIEKSDKEPVVNESEMSKKVESLVVVDELNKNGKIYNQEEQIGQAKTEKGEDEASENAPTQHSADENPTKE